MKKFKNIVVASLLLTSVTVFASAPQKGATPPPPKADVYVVPQPQNLALSLSYPAQIYSSKSVSVVARVSGVLEEKFFKEGDFVKKGQKLYKIEDNIYRVKVEASKASVQMAQASFDNASRNWKRVEKLYKKKVVSQENRDNALSQYEQATAALALSKANLNQANIDLEYTIVRAPIGGVVGLKQVDVGDYVSANTQTKLISITDNNKVNVEFSMPLSDYTNIKNGIWSIPESKKISVKLNIGNAKVQKTGEVDFIDVNANKNTATIKMRAVFDNSDSYLIPGSFLRVVLNDIVQKNVITIPQKALLQNPLGTIVFVEAKGKVGVRPVMIGDETGDKYIVAGGPLKSGDRVLVNNFFRLKPGGAVVVDKIINQKGK